MPGLADLLRTVLAPSDVERLIDAQTRQAAALERLVQLAEVALGVDPPSVEAAARVAGDPSSVVQVVDYKPQELQDLEDLITQMATTLGRMPSDEEIDAELQRQAATDAAAQVQAEYMAGTERPHGA